MADSRGLWRRPTRDWSREVSSIRVYEASWERDGLQESDTAQAMARHLEMRRRDERARRTSLVGPHRDEMTFLIDGRDARAFASQGQQRTIALAWKLAEVMVIEDVSGQPPVCSWTT